MINKTEDYKSSSLFPLSIAAALFIAVGLSACATGMSKKDCETKDYYQMGLEDGKDGKGAERLQHVTEVCSKQGVAVTADKYNYGRQVGLASYCTESRAQSDVKEGRGDSICIKDKVPPYETAYAKQIEKGRMDQEANLKDVQKEQGKLQEKQDKIQKNLNQLNQQKSAIPTK